MERPRRSQQSEKKLQKTLILVFEVIVQTPKAHFLAFLSDTKIMKITHSAETAEAAYLRPLWDLDNRRHATHVLHEDCNLQFVIPLFKRQFLTRGFSSLYGTTW